jgi:glycerol kinase
MSKADLILALDQGTTSTRAIVFDRGGRPLGVAQQELPQHYPQPGWVEHDPEDIWRDARAVLTGALVNAKVDARRIATLGITDQRETTLLWDRRTGQCLHRAIVWQDRRTAELCARLKAEGLEPEVQRKTGLLLDPYFSATKLGWILDHVEGARSRAERGELAFGTIDCFLLWRLTGGRVHATDATNASRTLLYDIRRGDWDEELLRLFKIPRQLLPEVRDSNGDFGVTNASVLGSAVPISGIAGDQQAATVGQACFRPGMMKSTYGTGCFALINTGGDCVISKSRLLSTIAYRIGGQTTYALEGAIFVAGAAVQWLRDALGLVASAAETETLAKAANPAECVYLVPAFVGLGAPYWDAEARGAIFGLTRGAGRAELARATLDSVCYQTRDLLQAMRNDGAPVPDTLRVDGGMVRNDWLMQRLADLTGSPVERGLLPETTALGAAFLAGLGAGLYGSTEEVARLWSGAGRFEPALAVAERDRAYAGWQDAVSRTLTRGGGA